MRDLLKPLLPMIIVLLAPIIPFLLFGEQISQWWDSWKDAPHSNQVIAGTVVALLTTDILLPIPSSLVATLAGWKLGTVIGAAVAWLGMSLGAVLGFLLGRRGGAPLVAWLTKPQDLARTATLVDRYGPALLVLGRGVPVLAEASVLLMGMHRLSWRRFLPPVLLSNLGLAVAYAAFGEVAERHQWLPLALAVSIALPVLLAAAVRTWIRV